MNPMEAALAAARANTTTRFTAPPPAHEEPKAPEPEPTTVGKMVWVEGTGGWVVEVNGEVRTEPMSATKIGLWCKENRVTLAYTPRPPDDFEAYLDAQEAKKKKGRRSS